MPDATEAKTSPGDQQRARAAPGIGREKSTHLAAGGSARKSVNANGSPASRA